VKAGGTWSGASSLDVSSGSGAGLTGVSGVSMRCLLGGVAFSYPRAGAASRPPARNAFDLTRMVAADVERIGGSG